jgi:AcrR family transcriptional regulator
MATMDREQRRAQILGIAAQVFAEKGYHDAKIEDIVARARVARGTFYLYFEDKRAIFEELVSGFVRQLAETIEPIETVPDSDPTRVMFELRSNLLRLVERFMAEPAMAKVLFSAAVGLDADFDQRLLAFYEEIAGLLERSLEQGEEAGLVRPGHRRIRAFCLTGIIKELLYQLILRRAVSEPAELVDAMLDLVTDGLFTDPARAAVRASSAPRATR